MGWDTQFWWVLIFNVLTFFFLNWTFHSLLLFCCNWYKMRHAVTAESHRQLTEKHPTVLWGVVHCTSGFCIELGVEDICWCCLQIDSMTMKGWAESKFGIDLCWNASWLMSQQGNTATDTSLKTPPKCADLPDSNQLNHHCVKGNSSRFPAPPQQSKCRTSRHRGARGFTTEEIQSYFWEVNSWLNMTQILNGSKFDFHFISQCRI